MLLSLSDWGVKAITEWGFIGQDNNLLSLRRLTCSWRQRCVLLRSAGHHCFPKNTEEKRKNVSWNVFKQEILVVEKYCVNGASTIRRHTQWSDMDLWSPRGLWLLYSALKRYLFLQLITSPEAITFQVCSGLPFVSVKLGCETAAVDCSLVSDGWKQQADITL